MRVLLLTHSFNSLCQRLFVELEAAGHEVSVEFDISDAVTQEAVALFRPDCLVAPFLKRAIPEEVWSALPCLIVHPGVEGDRGPSALDWAILKGVRRWGVTVLQAEREMDAVPVWASADFPMRPAAKSSLYRNEVTEAAAAAVLEAISRFERGNFVPRRVAAASWQPAMHQRDRVIDWASDDTGKVLRKIWSADGSPGLKSRLCGRSLYLHDAHAAESLKGGPGEIIGRNGDAIAVATADGAVWTGHLRDPESRTPIKLPALRVLGELGETLPLISSSIGEGYPGISYEEEGGCGFLHFRFYNGAMSTAACERLLAAYREALLRPIRVLVLMGGPDFWSNGMNLNLIEAAESPADESFRNINAIDEVAEAVLRTDGKMTVAALQGNAGAGGVFLARAADEVWLREGIVLSPHYKDMGNLYGSEFWTYSLPRRVGEPQADAIMRRRLPMGPEEAVRIGLADAHFGLTVNDFFSKVRQRAKALVSSAGFDERIAHKRMTRAEDERRKPLSAYLEEELARMRLSFYGFDPSYHIARYNFVRKVPKSRTPVTLARHRDRAGREPTRRASFHPSS